VHGHDVGHVVHRGLSEGRQPVTSRIVLLIDEPVKGAVLGNSPPAARSARTSVRSPGACRQCLPTWR
jgi:hypothetical protein